MKQLFFTIYILLTFNLFSQRNKTINTNNATTVVISPCGDYILSGNDKNSNIAFRNIKGKKVWKQKLDKSNQLESAAISCVKKIIVIGSQGNTLYIKNFKGHNLWTKEYNHSELQVDISGDGSKIFVGVSETFNRNENFLDCYDLSGKLLWRNNIQLNKWHIWGVSSDYSGNNILVKTNSDIFIFDTKRRILKKFDIVEGNSLHAAKIFKDGSKFYVASSQVGESVKIDLYDIEKGLIWSKKTPHYNVKIDIDQKNNLYSYGIRCRSNKIMVFQPNGKILKIIRADDSGTSISVSDDGKSIITSSFSELKILQKFDSINSDSFNNEINIIEPVHIIHYDKEGYIITKNTNEIFKIKSDAVKKEKTLKDSPYRNLTDDQLINHINRIGNELNYLKVQHFLILVEKLNHNHMPLTKIKNNELKAYWETVPHLQRFYFEWSKNARKEKKFKYKHEPGFSKLSRDWRDKKVELEKYYSRHRKLIANLNAKFPETYPKLRENTSKSLKKMWLESGKYMLKKYKEENKKIPIYWIPKNKLTSLKFNEKYIKLNSDLTSYKKEIKNRK